MLQTQPSERKQTHCTGEPGLRRVSPGLLHWGQGQRVAGNASGFGREGDASTLDLTLGQFWCQLSGKNTAQ